MSGMVSNIIRLFQRLEPVCGCCGGPGVRRTLRRKGRPDEVVVSCDACADAISDTLRRVRPIFRAMLRAGISLEIANDTMTYLLDRMETVS